MPTTPEQRSAERDAIRRLLTTEVLEARKERPDYAGADHVCMLTALATLAIVNLASTQEALVP